MLINFKELIIDLKIYFLLKKVLLLHQCQFNEKIKWIGWGTLIILLVISGCTFSSEPDTPPVIFPTKTRTPTANLTETAEVASNATTVARMKATFEIIATTLASMNVTATAVAGVAQTATAAKNSLPPNENISEVELTQTADTILSTTTKVSETETAIAVNHATAEVVATQTVASVQTTLANAYLTGTAIAIKQSTPTWTPTRIIELPAVDLINPSNNEVFVGKNANIVISWDWHSTLQADQYYFVEAKYTNKACEEDWPYFRWTKEKSIIVDTWLYDEMCPSKRTVLWTVYIKKPQSQTNDWQNQDAGIKLSPITESLVFEWKLAPEDSGSGTSPGGPGVIPPPTRRPKD